MHDASGVGDVEAHQHIARDLQRGAHGQDARIAEPRAEGHTVQQLQGEEEHAVADAEVVDDDDVGVGEAGDGPGLTLEAADDVGVVGEVGADHLEGDVAPEGVLSGPIDGAHAAATDQPGDDLAPSHDLADEGVRLACRRCGLKTFRGHSHTASGGFPCLYGPAGHTGAP